jgi:hypothetical protein
MHSGYAFRGDLSKPDIVLFKGLTRLLRQVCFPDYDYRRAKRLAGPTPRSLKRSTGLRRPWQGRSRGALGHEQVRIAVNAGEEAVGALLTGHGRLDIADDFLASLKHKHLRPITAEFIDFYEDWGVATGIDLLCMTTAENRHGADLLVPLEVKFGGENYFFDATGPLRAPRRLVGAYNNSPLNQAFLQLAFARQMLVDHYPFVTLGPAYVAQVRQNDTVYYRLPDNITEAASDIRDLVLRESTIA